MIISEKQILQLIYIAKAYVADLKATESKITLLQGESIESFLGDIARQQSDELREVEE